MFHAAIVDPKKTKKRISLLRAEKFIKDFDAGASIFFVGNIRKNNNNKNRHGVLVYKIYTWPGKFVEKNMLVKVLRLIIRL